MNEQLTGPRSRSLSFVLEPAGHDLDLTWDLDLDLSLTKSKKFEKNLICRKLMKILGKKNVAEEEKKNN